MSYMDNFKCRKCGKKFQAFVPDGAKWVRCPQCGNKMRIK